MMPVLRMVRRLVEEIIGNMTRHWKDSVNSSWNIQNGLTGWSSLQSSAFLWLYFFLFCKSMVWM